MESKTAVLCILMIGAAGAAVMTKLPVWINSYSTDNVLYATDIPAMDDFTICMWLQTPHYGLSDDAIVSFASESTSNDFLFYTSVTSTYCRISALFETTSRHMLVDCEEYLGLFVGKWHKLCLTVQRNIEVKVILDLHTPNVMEIWTNDTAPDLGMDGDDTMTIFQEQDEILGRFSLTQTLQGKLAWFNLWNRTLSLEEIQALDCRSRGNIISMDDLKQLGNPIISYNFEFPCGDYSSSNMERKIYHERVQTNMYCKVEGKTMTGPVLDTASVQKPIECAQLCSKDILCQSANYNKNTRDCTLIEATDVDYPENFSTDEAIIHFTSRYCI